MSLTSEWNMKQKQLNGCIRKADQFDRAKELLLEMHGSVHFAEASNTKNSTMLDELCNGLSTKDYAVMPTQKDETIAWSIWHITRIEDMTVNVLVNESKQILDADRLAGMGIQTTDTGNAMCDDEIMEFSKSIDIDALKAYRTEVGWNTRKILAALEFKDMKRKFSQQQLDRILSEHGVLEHPDSIWLLDFWGRKDVAGILLMPVTRHQIVHIHTGFRIKEALKKRKVFYRE